MENRSILDMLKALESFALEQKEDINQDKPLKETYLKIRRQSRLLNRKARRFLELDEYEKLSQIIVQIQASNVNIYKGRNKQNSIGFNAEIINLIKKQIEAFDKFKIVEILNPKSPLLKQAYDLLLVAFGNELDDFAQFRDDCKEANAVSNEGFRSVYTITRTYVAVAGGLVVAVANGSYLVRSNSFILWWNLVSPFMRGRGVGSKLVFARLKGANDDAKRFGHYNYNYYLVEVAAKNPAELYALKSAKVNAPLDINYVRPDEADGNRDYSLYIQNYWRTFKCISEENLILILKDMWLDCGVESAEKDSGFNETVASFKGRKVVCLKG